MRVPPGTASVGVTTNRGRSLPSPSSFRSVGFSRSFSHIFFTAQHIPISLLLLVITLHLLQPSGNNVLLPVSQPPVRDVEVDAVRFVGLMVDEVLYHGPDVVDARRKGGQRDHDHQSARVWDRPGGGRRLHGGVCACGIGGRLHVRRRRPGARFRSPCDRGVSPRKGGVRGGKKKLCPPPSPFTLWRPAVSDRDPLLPPSSRTRYSLSAKGPLECRAGRLPRSVCPCRIASVANEEASTDDAV